MNKVLIKGLALFLCVGIIAGCHAGKKTTTGKVKSTKTTRKDKKKAALKGLDTATAVVLGAMSVSDMATALILNEKAGKSGDFRTFSGKAKAQLTREGETNDLNANIRIRNGEAIWINISALGGLVNVARVYITPDSVRLVNFLQKNARLLPFAEAGNILPFPVSFADLQALLMGYAPPADALQPQGFKTISDKLLVTNTAGDNGQTSIFSLPDTVFSGYQISRVSGTQVFLLTMNLNDLALDGERRFYKKRTATWKEDNKDGELHLEFDSPQWDKELSMPFSVPKNYELN